MANSSSKGLAVGVIVLLLAVAAYLVMMPRQPLAPEAASSTAPAAVAPAMPASDETAAKDVPEKNEVSSAEPAPAGDIASPGLTSPTEEHSAATDAAPAPEAGDKTAAETGDKEAPPAAEEKGDSSLLAPPKALDIDIDKAIAERTLGRDDAPVSMIEYASMTCPHCARFHNTILPEIKQKLIDTGQLRLIFRDYPLDTFALKAAMMARCADPGQYFDLVEVIFKNQERWAKSSDPLKGLIQLGSLAGMSEDFINSCMADEQLQSAILNRVQEGQKNYKINATPTFVFNNGAETFSGDKDFNDFAAAVKRLKK